ncbi:MAG: hypothetical protein WAS55_05500, partial [Saprospiraceae bacterium]
MLKLPAIGNPQNDMCNHMTTVHTLNRPTMQLKTLFFFSILTILTSCNGQTKNNASNTDDLSKHIAQGDTVNKLGDHL